MQIYTLSFNELQLHENNYIKIFTTFAKKNIKYEKLATTKYTIYAGQLVYS